MGHSASAPQLLINAPRSSDPEAAVAALFDPDLPGAIGASAAPS